MAKNNYDDSDGVWRTIGGRRVFIKNGQSLSDAMKASGKFKKKQADADKEYIKKVGDAKTDEDLKKADEEYKKKTGRDVDEVTKKYEKDITYQNDETGENESVYKALYDMDKKQAQNFIEDLNDNGRISEQDYETLKDYVGYDSKKDLQKQADEYVKSGEKSQVADEKFEVSELKKKALATLPKEDIDTHEGDLYLKKTAKSEELIKNMKNADNGMLSTFKDQQTGETWYDIPFANWEDDYKEKTGKDWHEKSTNDFDKLDNYEVYEKADALARETKDYALKDEINKKLDRIDRANRRGSGYAEKPTNELREILKNQQASKSANDEAKKSLDKVKNNRVVEDTTTGTKYYEIGNGQWRSEKDGYDYYIDFNSSNKDNPAFKDVATGKIIDDNPRSENYWDYENRRGKYDETSKSTNETMNDKIREKASKKSTYTPDLPKKTEIKEQGTSNRKEVSENIQAHILDYYDSPEDFISQMDAMDYLPTKWKQGEELAKGGSYLIYNQDMSDFLDELKINPKGKSFSEDKAFDMYTSLVGRESAKLYDRLQKDAYRKYKQEHPLSQISFEEFKDKKKK